MRVSKFGWRGLRGQAYCVRAAGLPIRGAGNRADGHGRPAPGNPPLILPYALLCENSFSTGTPTLCRAREAQSRWKNSST
ncbi:hypothetical protein GCM10010309_12510 [Streptomyces violaceochromogenes]|nr:hypothetical protein GCM10010309_12510 [Streptomyces violaceochromogenes]